MGTFTHLGNKALYLIATLPEEERQKEHITSKGETKTPDEMTVRELQRLTKEIKERDDIQVNSATLYCLWGIGEYRIGAATQLKRLQQVKRLCNRVKRFLLQLFMLRNAEVFYGTARKHNSIQ